MIDLRGRHRACDRTKAKTYKLRAITSNIAQGRELTVKLALPASAQTAIKRAPRAGKRIVVAVKVTVADVAGNKRTLTRNVRLRR